MKKVSLYPLALAALVMVCLAAVGPVWAQETGDAALHSALKPVSRMGDEWWAKRHEGMNARVKQGNADLVFIGDSITQGWEGPGKATWTKYYGDRNAVNLGISGDRTQHVLWRLENGNIEGISPKLAVIMIGTNNHKDNTAEEIADGVKAIVKKLRTELPEMKILLLAIFPREEKPGQYRAKLAKASEIFSSVADGKMVQYLDIGEAFLEDDGTLPKAIMPDALHPGKDGYEIWASSIEPKVAELLGDKCKVASK